MVEAEPTTPGTAVPAGWHTDGGGCGGDNVVAPMHAVTNVYRSRELLWNLTLRELRTKYRRSFLGWAWSMLNPLSQILIYGFVFGTLFNATAPLGDPSGLDSFAFFLLCGLLPWNFFSLVTSLGLGAVSANAGLVRRVAFPREVLVFSNVLHACVQFSIELTLLLLVLLVAGSPFLPWLPVVFLTSVLLAVFATGIAMALSVLAVYFRDVSYLWAILIQVWFFATPIVYPPSLLEERAPTWVQNVLNLNPMNGFVETYRRLLYDASAPGWKTMVGLLTISAVSLTVGWTIFNRMSRRLPEEV
jgi:ABC-type polysaccharide/polyol phosphate export permease